MVCVCALVVCVCINGVCVCVCALVVCVQYCVTLLTNFMVLYTYIHIIWNCRTTGSIGPPSHCQSVYKTVYRPTMRIKSTLV